MNAHMGTYYSGSKTRPTRNEFPDGPDFLSQFSSLLIFHLG